jgi:hypothetical protein
MKQIQYQVNQVGIKNVQFKQVAEQLSNMNIDYHCNHISFEMICFYSFSVPSVISSSPYIIIVSPILFFCFFLVLLIFL